MDFWRRKKTAAKKETPAIEYFGKNILGFPFDIQSFSHTFGQPLPTDTPQNEWSRLTRLASFGTKAYIFPERTF